MFAFISLIYLYIHIFLSFFMPDRLVRDPPSFQYAYMPLPHLFSFLRSYLQGCFVCFIIQRGSRYINGTFYSITKATVVP
ncbi:hypothetical protein BX666DRAFT_1970028 [Dichotomocladium elegans]|nr:hypothetical protein BX666DRAFT_1970028 [Dichotomocladium elegans]